MPQRNKTVKTQGGNKFKKKKKSKHCFLSKKSWKFKQTPCYQGRAVRGLVTASHLLVYNSRRWLETRKPPKNGMPPPPSPAASWWHLAAGAAVPTCTRVALPGGTAWPCRREEQRHLPAHGWLWLARNCKRPLRVRVVDFFSLFCSKIALKMQSKPCWCCVAGEGVHL